MCQLVWIYKNLGVEESYLESKSWINNNYSYFEEAIDLWTLCLVKTDDITIEITHFSTLTLSHIYTKNIVYHFKSIKRSLYYTFNVYMNVVL